MKKRIVIFASGSGTNTQNVIQYFQQQPIAEVVLVLTNKKDAQVIARAESLNTKAVYFSKPELLDPNGVLQVLKDAQPDLIVLAGFLLKFPDHILKAFPKLQRLDAKRCPLNFNYDVFNMVEGNTLGNLQELLSDLHQRIYLLHILREI